MNIIDYKTKHRKYKIANILGKEYNDEIFHKIYNHYKKNMDISKMKMFTVEKYSNYIFYGYSIDDIYIQCSISTNTFWLDHFKIWSFFETEFNYSKKEIQELTETILKEHLNLKNITITTYITTETEKKLLIEYINSNYDIITIGK